MWYTCPCMQAGKKGKRGKKAAPEAKGKDKGKAGDKKKVVKTPVVRTQETEGCGGFRGGRALAWVLACLQHHMVPPKQLGCLRHDCEEAGESADWVSAWPTMFDQTFLMGQGAGVGRAGLSRVLTWADMGSAGSRVRALSMGTSLVGEMKGDLGPEQSTPYRNV